MIIVYSKNDVAIRLTKERWNHIVNRHPELFDQKEKVLQTITNPIAIYKELSNKDGFLITAYFTNKPSERRQVIWKQ